MPLTQALSASRPWISLGSGSGYRCYTWAVKSSAMILSVRLRSPFHRSFQGPASAALAELDMMGSFLRGAVCGLVQARAAESAVLWRDWFRCGGAVMAPG